MKIGFALAALVIATAPAFAQTDIPPSSGNGKLIPGGSGSTTKQESLSNKLTKSDGVITPKSDVDPGIKVPAPDPHPNSMPVIPPSATGGNSAK